MNDAQARNNRREERVLQLFRLLNYSLKKEKVLYLVSCAFDILLLFFLFSLFVRKHANVTYNLLYLKW